MEIIRRTEKKGGHTGDRIRYHIGCPAGFTQDRILYRRLFSLKRLHVLSSLLAVFIVIGLYVLFLGDVWTDDLNGFEGARERILSK